MTVLSLFSEIYNTDLYVKQVNVVDSSRINLLTMVGLSKSGYLEVKQPSNIKGRKLKVRFFIT